MFGGHVFRAYVKVDSLSLSVVTHYVNYVLRTVRGDIGLSCWCFC